MHFNNLVKEFFWNEEFNFFIGDMISLLSILVAWRVVFTLVLLLYHIPLDTFLVCLLSRWAPIYIILRFFFSYNFKSSWRDYQDYPIYFLCLILHFPTIPYNYTLEPLSILFPFVEFFHTRVCREAFTWVWDSKSSLVSSRFFSVFWPFSIMLSFGWSPLVLFFPSPPVHLLILWRMYQLRHRFNVL